MMKKLFTFCVLSAICSAAVAGWVPYAESSDSTEHYYDDASIKREGKKITLWAMDNSPYGKRISVGTLHSVASQVVIDCSTRESAETYSIAYSGEMTTGSVLKSERRNGGLTPTVPGSVFEILINRVCRRR